MRGGDPNARSHLSLAELVGHAWRVGSPRVGGMALAAAAFRLVRSSWWTDKAPWYVGRALRTRVGSRIRIDGRVFELPLSADFPWGVAWLGMYETSERYAVARFLRRALPVVELGGAAGVVSCLTNRLLTSPARHVVVEANPLMVPVLQRNRDRNGCRFTIVNAALAYGEEPVEFRVADDFRGSSIAAAGDRRKVTIPSVSLAKVAAEAGFDRFTLVCDIEGAEVSLLRMEGELLGRSVESVLMEVHPGLVGVDTVTWLRAELERLGFAPVWACGDVWFLTRRATRGLER